MNVYNTCKCKFCNFYGVAKQKTTEIMNKLL